MWAYEEKATELAIFMSCDRDFVGSKRLYFLMDYLIKQINLTAAVLSMNIDGIKWKLSRPHGVVGARSFISLLVEHKIAVK